MWKNVIDSAIMTCLEAWTFFSWDTFIWNSLLDDIDYLTLLLASRIRSKVDNYRTSTHAYKQRLWKYLISFGRYTSNYFFWLVWVSLTLFGMGGIKYPCQFQFIASFELFVQNLWMNHCMKSVQIRSYFRSIFSCIQYEYRKIRTRNNSVFGHFSRSVYLVHIWRI